MQATDALIAALWNRWHLDQQLPLLRAEAKRLRAPAKVLRAEHIAGQAQQTRDLLEATAYAALGERAAGFSLADTLPLEVVP